jgi:hypothetical protein
MELVQMIPRVSHTPSVTDKAPFGLDGYQMSLLRRARRWLRAINGQRVLRCDKTWRNYIDNYVATCILVVLCLHEKSRQALLLYVRSIC